MKFLSFLCWLFSISAILNTLSGKWMWNEQSASTGQMVGNVGFAVGFVFMGMMFWTAAGSPE